MPLCIPYGMLQSVTMLKVNVLCIQLVSMPKDRYPNQLLSHEWQTKPCRGKQRKACGRVVDEHKKMCY